MRKRIISFLVFACALTSYGVAQKYSKTFFTVSQGLPQSEVSSICEDKVNGYLWMATRGGGLTRFDGKSFYTYTIEDGILSNIIYKVFIDSKGNIWSGTRRGLSKLDGEKFINFHKLKNVFTHIIEFNDTIFAMGRDHSLVKIFDDSVYQVRVGIDRGTEIREIHSTSPQWAYFFYNNNVLIRRGIHGTDHIDLNALGRIYNLFAFGDQINIVSERGAYTWWGSDLKLVESQLKSAIVYTDKDFKTIWTYESDHLEKMVRNPTLSVADTLDIDVRIFDCLVDAEGDTWFGTQGNGLIKYSSHAFELIKKGVVTAVGGIRDELWVATREKGIEILENGKVTKRFDLGKYSFINRIKMIGRNNVWASGQFGIVRIDVKRNLHKIFDATQFGSVTDIEFDNESKLWIGQQNGISYCDINDPTGTLHRGNLLPKWILNIKYVPFGKRIIAGTIDGVNEILNGKVLDIAPRFDSTSSYSIMPYKNKYLVIGSVGRGICIYNLENGLTKYYSKKNGLASYFIHFVNVDEKNRLWIGGDRGIERISLNDRLQIEEYIHFTDDHGFMGLEANVSFFDAKSKYFGSVDGLYRFFEIKNEDTPEYPLHFVNIELINSESKITSYAKGTYGFFHIPVDPVLPFDQNSISFSFAKVFKRYPNATHYKFQLIGQDEDWSQPTSSKEVIYRNLKPGNYTFQVVARNHDGQWMNKPIEYSFVIAPPFYATSLFYTIVTLIIIAAIGLGTYLYVQWKIKALIKQERLKQEIQISVRKEIGIDFHDELGNQLARIINYVSLIKLSDGKANDFLTGIEDTTKKLISGTKDFIWALDQHNDTVESLYVHLKDFGDRLLPEKGIEFRAFYLVQEEVPLPFGAGRQINFIFKEAMTNAFKYSQAKHISLQFKKMNAQLLITLTEDGVGIPYEKLTSSNGGISNMKLRSRKIHGELAIESTSDETKISLLINV